MLINLPLLPLDWGEDACLCINESYLKHLDELDLEWLYKELESINWILSDNIERKTWILELKKTEILRRILEKNKERALSLTQ